MFSLFIFLIIFCWMHCAVCFTGVYLKGLWLHSYCSSLSKQIFYISSRTGWQVSESLGIFFIFFGCYTVLRVSFFLLYFYQSLTEPFLLDCNPVWLFVYFRVVFLVLCQYNFVDRITALRNILFFLSEL